MNKELTTDLKNKKSITVEHKHSANEYGSGLLDVFSTPAMIALMEQTSNELLMPYLNDNETSVGIEINVKHLKATPVGDTVICYVQLIEIRKNRITFKVEAFDSKGKIGEGIHKRAIVDKQLFMTSVLNLHHS